MPKTAKPTASTATASLPTTRTFDSIRFESGVTLKLAYVPSNTAKSIPPTAS